MTGWLVLWIFDMECCDMIKRLRVVSESVKLLGQDFVEISETGLAPNMVV